MRICVTSAKSLIQIVEANQIHSTYPDGFGKFLQFFPGHFIKVAFPPGYHEVASSKPDRFFRFCFKSEFSCLIYDHPSLTINMKPGELNGKIESRSRFDLHHVKPHPPVNRIAEFPPLSCPVDAIHVHGTPFRTPRHFINPMVNFPVWDLSTEKFPAGRPGQNADRQQISTFFYRQIEDVIFRRKLLFPVTSGKSGIDGFSIQTAFKPPVGSHADLHDSIAPGFKFIVEDSRRFCRRLPQIIRVIEQKNLFGVTWDFSKRDVPD